jgi:site-specific DNA-methyltransferase (adenine-specific)
MVNDYVYNKSCESMKEIKDESIHLIVTSPPYNVGLNYDEYNDKIELDEYRKFAKRWLLESYRVLKNGGRICINVAQLFRKPSCWNLAFEYEKLLYELGFINRGTIIWVKSNGRGTTAWGSFGSPSEPNSHDIHEYILCFSKNTLRLENDVGTNPDITNKEFVKYVNSVWIMGIENDPKHPCTFPSELPYRCIKLLTYPMQNVLDPFAGLGTTLITAKKLNRVPYGYEISKSYYDIIVRRLADNYL